MNQPYFYHAYVRSVYDGDSMTLDIDMGFGITNKIKVRLHGIDTPEVRRSKHADAEHVKRGKAIRDQVRARILRKRVIVQTFQNKNYDSRKGKYGRYLVRVWFPVFAGQWLCLNDVLAEFEGVRLMDDRGRIIKPTG